MSQLLVGPEFSSIGFKILNARAKYPWLNVGKLSGNLVAQVDIIGKLNYRYVADKNNPLTFTRASGDKYVLHEDFMTDGGSIPRLFWSFDPLDPWTYILGYLFHDYWYELHHCDPTFTMDFTTANTILLEIIYTMMMNGMFSQNWRACVAIWTALCSNAAQNVWAAEWTTQQCDDQLIRNNEITSPGGIILGKPT